MRPAQSRRSSASSRWRRTPGTARPPANPARTPPIRPMPVRSSRCAGCVPAGPVRGRQNYPRRSPGRRGPSACGDTAVPIPMKDHSRAGKQRKPELLKSSGPPVPSAKQPRERAAWLGAPFDRRHLLDHQRESERGEHVQMLIQLAQHRPHRDHFGHHARSPRRRPASPRSRAPAASEPQDEQRAEHAAQHGPSVCPAVKLITREAEYIEL